ncbi:MAG TPA: hypothetical protein VM681_05420 [Candidatus Thermoplasmatota archaeon]|nr:hypothetical protein [Candidatus Thermoplasmatota archaeon]
MDRLFEPGLCLVDAPRNAARRLFQTLAHRAVHRDPHGHVLWCDGDHGFDPYDFAEENLVRGFAADEGADRVLVKRCMTPFQWDAVLTKHLSQKLSTTRTSLVLVLPFDALFSTEELADWEQVDYVTYGLSHLSGLAARHAVPILLGVDLRRWSATLPELAAIARQAVARQEVLGRTLSADSRKGA